MLIYLVSSAILTILFFKLSGKFYKEEVSMPDEDLKKPEDKHKEETKPKLTQEEKEKRELLKKEKTPAAMLFRAQTALTEHFNESNEEVAITTIIKGLDDDDQVDLKVIAETNKKTIAIAYANGHKEKDALMIFSPEETRELHDLLTRVIGR